MADTPVTPVRPPAGPHARPRVVVVGDVLLDRDWDGRITRLSPEPPAPVVDEPVEVRRPGGAGLAALMAASDGADVTLVCALSRDDAGRELATTLRAAGVAVLDLGLDGPTPEKLRIRADGRALVRVDRHCEPVAGIGAWTAEASAAMARADAVLVSCYGRGMSASTALHDTLSRVVREHAAVVWDPHPRGATPHARTTVATPNLAEAARVAHRTLPADAAGVLALAGAVRRCWGVDVALTAGPMGAVLSDGGPPRLLPAVPAEGDTCGAGDRFASTVAVRSAAGLPLFTAVRDGVAAATAHVASGGLRRRAAAPSPRTRTTAAAPPDAVELAGRMRAGGGTVVATGGCFDLLHPGHVRTLEAARSLGDCLIVCLNSDTSVTALKGPSRPLVPQQDRADVLLGLACVDAVLVFDERTPCAALERLRPHVFAKGGDYAGADLPERAVLAAWGGELVLLPFLGGRSTSALVEAISGGRAVARETGADRTAG